MKHLQSHKKIGFKHSSLHNAREPHAVHYLSQRTSFWVATLCLFTFLIGNMMGQHGWHAFWASVLGKTDDSLIVYTGTVTPVAFVPDYEKWYYYGGDSEEHTYRQVPKDILVELPTYHSATAHEYGAYSVGHLGSYSSGRDSSGSHPGVDIRVPIGTPVRAIANGVVTEVKDGGGFGKVIVIRHPNVPNPDNPVTKTTLFSSYAHMSAQYVSVDSVVQKGEQIGLSGDSGFASGPHLHFQIDTDNAPWHPYWPFSGDEARAVGMTTAQAVDAGLHQDRGKMYTVSPLLYVQANYAPPPNLKQRVLARANARRSSASDTPAPIILLAEESSSSTAFSTHSVSQVVATVEPELEKILSAAELLIERATERGELRKARIDRIPTITTVAEVTDSSDLAIELRESDDATQKDVTKITSVSFRHDGEFTGREWELIRVTLLDENGYTIQQPTLNGDLHVQTAYGDAEFRPEVLSELDFVNGIAAIYVLPRGRRTVVLKLEPLPTLSKPMRYVQ